MHIAPLGPLDPNRCGKVSLLGRKQGAGGRVGHYVIYGAGDRAGRRLLHDPMGLMVLRANVRNGMV
jgi:hypothetical protein